MSGSGGGVCGMGARCVCGVGVCGRAGGVGGERSLGWVGVRGVWGGVGGGGRSVGCDEA